MVKVMMVTTLWHVIVVNLLLDGPWLSAVTAWHGFTFRVPGSEGPTSLMNSSAPSAERRESPNWLISLNPFFQFLIVYLSVLLSMGNWLFPDICPPPSFEKSQTSWIVCAILRLQRSVNFAFIPFIQIEKRIYSLFPPFVKHFDDWSFEFLLYYKRNSMEWVWNSS